MKIRDRIVELRRVKASELIPNHPKKVLALFSRNPGFPIDSLQRPRKIDNRLNVRYATATGHADN